jgi:hypothetical protein
MKEKFFPPNEMLIKFYDKLVSTFQQRLSVVVRLEDMFRQEYRDIMQNIISNCVVTIIIM